MYTASTSPYNAGGPMLPELPELAHSVELRVFRHPGLQQNNDRLQVFGAAILPALVTQWLLRTRPQADSGHITQERSRRVDRDTVARWARVYDLHNRLEADCNQATVRQSPRAQASVLYAYIAAVQEQEGWETVTKWIEELLTFDADLSLRA